MLKGRLYKFTPEISWKKNCELSKNIVGLQITIKQRCKWPRSQSVIAVKTVEIL